MFYNQLVKLCKERNIKPTTLLRSLGLSTANLQKWQNGATVNSGILEMLSNYFDVSVDYFFKEEEAPSGTTEDINTFKLVYNVLKAQPEYIASMQNGKLCDVRLNQISKYLGCTVEHLTKGYDVGGILDKETTVKSVKEHLMCVMNKIPADEGFSFLVVKISYIIMNNLEKLDIGQSELIDLKLGKEKIELLYNKSIHPSKKKGFNLSDLSRIAEHYNLSFDFLFTGTE